MIGTLRSEVSANQEVVTEGGSSKKVPCMWWTALGGVVVYRRGYIKSFYVRKCTMLWERTGSKGHPRSIINGVVVSVCACMHGFTTDMLILDKSAEWS